LKPIRDGVYQKGEKERVVFRKGDLFYRRGTQSIPPSQLEKIIIERRLEKENYRISVLSGEPDEVDETIYSNLFPILKFPNFVFHGIKKDYDNVTIKVMLKQEGVFPEFYFKFVEWNKRIVTFENIYDENNPHNNLVELGTIEKEPIEIWLNDPDKSRIIMDLLNREFKHYAISKGLFYFKATDKLYYPTADQKRREGWKGRHGKSTRTVATKIYVEQLDRYIYWNAAFFSNFIQFNKGNFFLRILPTFVLTDDGKRAIKGFTEGTVITRLSYNKYNDSFLNTILFWIYQLGNGHDIFIKDYLTISCEPLKSEISVGILFDIPSSEFRLEIEEEEGTLEDYDEFD
jgi:hypothetical protein